MTSANHIIFDYHRLAMHRTRVADKLEEFLLREMTQRLCDRLLDISRNFPKTLNISPIDALLRFYSPPSAGIETIEHYLPDEEEILPFVSDSFDLVFACGSLHWINDLPGMLTQIKHVLKPDGLFLALMPGGETLTELRQSFEAAEMAAYGGISPRVSPFVDIRDAGSLLQRAGFALPVVDSEMLSVEYTHPLKLLQDLRRMGESNAMAESKKTFTPASLIMQMADHYFQHFSNENERITASFELLTLTAWKPHASQQQPAKRGSGQVNLSILE